MKITLYENRNYKKDYLENEGTSNENNATLLKIKFPDGFENYAKRIVFITPEGNYEDLITNDTYLLTNAITKFKEVDAYIRLTFNDIDWRSKTFPLVFNENEEYDNEIPEEKIDELNTILDQINNNINEIKEIETVISDFKSYIETFESDVESGKYDGKDGYTPQRGVDYWTEEDKQEVILETVEKSTPQKGIDYWTESDKQEIVSETIEDINPALDNNLKLAKDYTDNSIARDFNDITYDNTTSTFVFTRHDNTTFTVDLPIEQTVKDGRYDEETGELILVLVSGQEIRIPGSGLIDDYTGVDSATIQCVISSDNKITCNIIAGSITKTLLTTELQTELDNKVNKEVLNDYVKNTDYATSSTAGIVKPMNGILTDGNGAIVIQKATKEMIDAKTDNYRPIVPGNLEYAVMKALSDSKSNWTDEEKSNVRTLLNIQTKIQEATGGVARARVITVSGNTNVAIYSSGTNCAGKLLCGSSTGWGLIEQSEITKTQLEKQLADYDQEKASLQSQINSLINAHVTLTQSIQQIIDMFDNYATKEQLNEIESIAKGRATGYVFDNLDDLNLWLENPENVAQLVLGDNLYIRATNVPDYWWDGTTKQQLETQKVDLSEYLTEEQVNALIDTKIAAITNYEEVAF